MNKHQIHFLQKPQKTQPCIIQGTGVDLCGLPPLTKQATVSNCDKTLSVSTQIIAAVKHKDGSQPPLQRRSRSALHIVTMFRDKGLSYAQEIP